jgi:GT2 family glycosyltransferase/glycosyltransferase involved in cell wall biosynthesis
MHTKNAVSESVMTARQKSRLVTRKGKSEAVERQPTGVSPRFSIILCTYNRRNLVLSALASLRRQTLPYNTFEVIVVDNGSSDGTSGAVRTYVSAGRHQDKKTDDTWKVVCLSEPQNGLAYARNTGLLAASGEIAVFLDDDAIADQRLLERLWQAYQETDADAIGARVDLRWEAPRPHWLTEDMLDMLGHFEPASERIKLSAPASFSSSCFSVKIATLRATGYFSPFLSKRDNLPASAEVQDMCRRLYTAGYALWYEPTAIAAHRVAAVRLTRAFIMGRAYWKGRSEVMARYQDSRQQHSFETLGAALRELREIVFLACIHRPLLRLAGRSSNERLQAATEQARSLGRFQQRLSFLEHAPSDLAVPAVFFARAPDRDDTADLLLRALQIQEIRCAPGNPEIPLPWLWQHRAYRGRCIGILHFYRPGALDLSHRQQQKLAFRLWLARRWGIRIITTDAGGWWQSARGLRFLARRTLERQLMRRSHAIFSFTRQPDQLYPDRKLRRKLRCLPHPGYAGYLPPLIARHEARKQLDFPEEAGFTFLCLAPQHNERELSQLIEAFRKAKQAEKSEGEVCSPIQLLLVGAPCDKKVSACILKLAALTPSLHLHGANPDKDELSLYISAADALVLPHFAIHTAGMLETAMLALSCGRVVIAPNLPRFCGMLPPRASILYDPASRESLIRALLDARQREYHPLERDKEALDAESGWAHYADRLVKVYREVLQRKV